MTARPGTAHDAARAALLLLCVLLGTSCGPAPEPGRPREAGIVVDAGATALAFEPAVLELGPVVPHGFAEATATVRNVGREPLTVIDYNAPCECTNARPELPRELRPGETMSVPVRLDLDHLARGGLPPEGSDDEPFVERELTLSTRRGRKAELLLRARVTDRLVVEPVVVDFPRLVVGEAGEASVRVGPGRARPDEPVQVLAARPRGGGPAPEVELRPDGAGVELGLRLAPFEEAGTHESELLLWTDAQPEPVPLLLRAEVVDLLEASPARIDMLGAAPGEPVLVRIAVRRRDGRPLERLEASATSGRVFVETLGPIGGGAQALRVTAAVRPWPEETVGEVRLQTEIPGGAGRLTIPVRVQARRPR